MNLLKFSLLLVCCIGGASATIAFAANIAPYVSDVTSSTISFKASVVNAQAADIGPFNFGATRVTKADGAADVDAVVAASTIAVTPLIATGGAIPDAEYTATLSTLNPAEEYIFKATSLVFTHSAAATQFPLTGPLAGQITICTLPKDLAIKDDSAGTTSDFNVASTAHMITLAPGTNPTGTNTAHYGSHYKFVSASTGGTPAAIESEAYVAPTDMVPIDQTMHIRHLKSATQYTVTVQNFMLSKASNAEAGGYVKAATPYTATVCTALPELNYKEMKAYYKAGTKGLTIAGTSGTAGNEFELYGDNNGPLGKVSVNVSPTITDFTNGVDEDANKEFNFVNFQKGVDYTFTVTAKGVSPCDAKTSAVQIKYVKGDWTVKGKEVFGGDKNGSMGLTGSSALLVALVAALFA